MPSSWELNVALASHRSSPIATRPPCWHSSTMHLGSSEHPMLREKPSLAIWNTPFKKCPCPTHSMGGVYCPTCEAGVEVTAKFCLSCGHDLTAQGPITATGHDLNQLKDVIRIRDDLSMAEKFDMIAKIEDGADPIALGIAAAGDEPEPQEAGPTPASTVVAPALQKHLGRVMLPMQPSTSLHKGTKLADLKSSGAFEKENKRFTEAMDIGRTATLHLLEVSQGAVLPASEAMQSSPSCSLRTKASVRNAVQTSMPTPCCNGRNGTTCHREALTIQLGSSHACISDAPLCIVQRSDSRPQRPVVGCQEKSRRSESSTSSCKGRTQRRKGEENF